MDEINNRMDTRREQRDAMEAQKDEFSKKEEEKNKEIGSETHKIIAEIPGSR